MDIAQLLKDWFASEKTEVDPSLLAYVLLCKKFFFDHSIQDYSFFSTCRFDKECDRTCRYYKSSCFLLERR